MVDKIIMLLIAFDLLLVALKCVFFIASFNISIFSINIGFLLCVTMVIKIY